MIIVVVYVDDFITSGLENNNFKEFRTIFEKRFGMKESKQLDWICQK
jgi:hypothetical protein